MYIQDARKTFVSKTPPKFDFSTVSKSVIMLTDNIQVYILRITGFRNIMSIPCSTFSIVMTFLPGMLESTDEISDPYLLARNEQKSKDQNFYFSLVIIHCLTILKQLFRVKQISKKFMLSL